MEEASCGVCMEPNENGRYNVTCHACGLDTCNECILNYFEHTPGVDQLGCMGYQCGARWDVGRIRRMFRFEDFVRLHKFNVDSLMARELDYMKITYNKWIVINLERRIEALKDQMKNAMTDIYNMTAHNFDMDLLENSVKTKSDLDQLKKDLDEQKSAMEASIVAVCATRDCPGYITDKSDVCLTCYFTTCRDCGQCKEDSHVCNPDEVKTMKELRENSRQCPSCNTRIFKIEGCDQMYCINCKTGFDWTTGNILNINRNFHNPELSDERNRPDPNFGCFLRGNITTEDYRYFPNVKYVRDEMENIIKMEELLEANEVAPYGPDTNDQLRMRILDKGKTLQDPQVYKQFNRVVRAWSLVNERNNTYNELFSSYTRVIKDLLINLQRQVQDNDGNINRTIMEQFRTQTSSMREYFTDQLTKTNEFYGYTPGEPLQPSYVNQLSQLLLSR